MGLRTRSIEASFEKYPNGEILLSISSKEDEFGEYSSVIMTENEAKLLADYIKEHIEE
jgi:hypothetical protein